MDKKVKLEQAELFELERVIYRADELDSDGREHAVVGKQRRAENQTRDEAAPKHRARNVKRRRAELRREDLDGFAEQFYTALTLCRAIGQQRNRRQNQRRNDGDDRRSRVHAEALGIKIEAEAREHSRQREAEKFAPVQAEDDVQTVDRRVKHVKRRGVLGPEVAQVERRYTGQKRKHEDIREHLPDALFAQDDIGRDRRRAQNHAERPDRLARAIDNVKRAARCVDVQNPPQHQQRQNQQRKRRANLINRQVVCILIDSGLLILSHDFHPFHLHSGPARPMRIKQR